MSKFLDTLCTNEISDSIFEVAITPFRYESNIAGRLFTVPVGFFTDFASVPRLGMVYALLGNYAHQPAVIHDWLYYSAIVSRKMADAVLFEAMGVINLSWWRRDLIFSGVRIGGWHAWNEHRKVGDPLHGKFADSPDIKGIV